MADVTPEMEQAKARVEERLLALPGVTGVDIGFKEVGGELTDQLAIRVLVKEKKPIDDVPEDERIPNEIDGHPADVIQRRFELHSTGAYVAEDDVLPPVDAGAYSPVKGGISVGPCRAVGGFVHAGTLGAIVVDNASGRHFALSNFHVLAVDENAADGDAIVQPSRIEGGRCPAQTAGKLRRHALTGAVDAAVMDLAAAQGVRPEVVEIGELTGTGTASLGQPVRKRGRTTRLTYGVVDSVSLTVIIDYGHGIGEKTLTGQIGVRPDPARGTTFSAHGDSGSVVVGDAREVVGLLFAGDDTGYGVANPIAEVLSALDISLATAPAAKRMARAGDTKFFPEFKDRFGGKERKSDKTEFKDDKDLKNEDKEIKDLKDENKENKDGKDLKDDPDKAGKDEAKESKDKTEKPEFKNESKDEGKDSKDKQEKDESKEDKDGKDDKDKIEKPENKELKDTTDAKLDKDKHEKPEIKDTKGEFKDRGKEDKESPFEIAAQTAPSPTEQRIAALEAAIARLTGATETGGARDEPQLRKIPKPEKLELKEKGEKREAKEIKLEKPEKDKVEKFEKNEKSETKEKPEKLEKQENKEDKDHKDQIKEIKEKPEKETKEGKREIKEIKEDKREGKDIKSEKPENKDFDPDRKLEEKPLKEQSEGPNLPIDWRLQTLENRVANLSHFILRSMRPDLSQGALHREPDVQDDTTDQEDS